MSTKTNVFVLGATGYIGGSVLSLFLEREDFNITVLVRSPEKASKLRNLGFNSVVGSHSDLQLIEKLAKENEVVLSLADSDSLEPIQALLRGLKAQYEATGKVPNLIHTSGTGALVSNGKGYLVEDYEIYDDANDAQMASIPLTAIHRNVDSVLVASDAEGYVKTYIILPSTIYGIPKTKLAEIGVQNIFSIQIPHLIVASLDRGKAAIAGDGSSVWPHVSIEDVSALYLDLYNSIVNNPNTGHGAQGYYIAENGEYTLLEAGQKIGEALVELGKASSPNPVPMSPEEIGKYFRGSYYIASTSRCHGNRSRSIGWKPTKTTEDFLVSIKPDVEALVRTGHKLPSVPWPSSFA
ncbi:NAD(P)-binding protein [Cyathus striatus]|nr:NAD(P)-binding protein [Cyathus striatus]